LFGYQAPLPAILTATYYASVMKDLLSAMDKRVTPASHVAEPDYLVLFL
jgi:hypothetical protein